MTAVRRATVMVGAVGFAALILALVLASDRSAAQSAGDDDIARRRGELARLKKQLESESAEAEKAARREKKVLGEIQAVDRQLTTTRAYMKKLGEQEKAIKARLGRLELEIAAREAELTEARSRLAYRVREIYKTGKPGLLEVVFSSVSLPDLFNRIHFMTRLADEEKRLMDTIEEARHVVVETRAEVERSYIEVQQIESEQLREEQRMSEIRRNRQAQIENLRKKREAHEAAAEELRVAQEKLTELIRRLEEQRRAAPDFVPPSGPFAEARGKLPWPVRGKVLQGYGRHIDPDFKTATQNNGIDIEAPAGTAVRAVADGRVDYRDWLTGYGNCVILNHGGGYYTLYAHLSQVLVGAGETVPGGLVIGAVGDTGSLKGNMLHFEVRQGSKAIDPAGWLVR